VKQQENAVSPGKHLKMETTETGNNAKNYLLSETSGNEKM
jgi:hypothetical protein